MSRTLLLAGTEYGLGMPAQLAPIVTVDWLVHELAQQHSTDAAAAAHPQAGNLAIVHVGTTMTGHDPYQTYLDGHLPGARFVSLNDDLADTPAPIVGRHPLPAAASVQDVLARLGISADTRVVAYDDRNGAFAARLVWMLRLLDQPAALLDGDRDAWPGALATGPAPDTPVPADRPNIDWPAGALADADTVAAHIATGGVVIDSREPARYRGEVEPIDAVAGHVPGAINLPFGDNLVDGRWRPASELATRFEALGDDPNAIVYCGSGVTACHNALAIEAAGLPRPRIYVGSWSGWSSDPDRPIATGSSPGGAGTE